MHFLYLIHTLKCHIATEDPLQSTLECYLCTNSFASVSVYMKQQISLPAIKVVYNGRMASNNDFQHCIILSAYDGNEVRFGIWSSSFHGRPLQAYAESTKIAAKSAAYGTRVAVKRHWVNVAIDGCQECYRMINA